MTKATQRKLHEEQVSFNLQLDNFGELKKCLIFYISYCRRKGYTWDEIGYRFFQMIQECIGLVESKEEQDVFTI